MAGQMDASTLNSAGGVPAPYGRACTNCSRAKCKCILRAGGTGACERCHRLKKDCQPANVVRKRPKKPSSASRTAILEEKLEDLVFLLRASRSNDPNGVSHDAINAPFSQATANGNARQASASSLPTPASTLHQTNSPVSSVDDDYEPSAEEAEAFLNEFRTRKLKWLPFVYIPSTVSAQQLRDERPFLWLCIMSVSTKTTTQQMSFGNRIRQTLAQKLIVEHERSMDYLLGLITYLAWANYQMGTKPFMSMYSQVLIALVQDLGLNRSPEDIGNSMLHWKNHGCNSQKVDMRTMEHRRTVAGAFLITSNISSFLQRPDSLVWTPHMEESLQILEDREECPGDRVLVTLVRLQLLEEDAFRRSWRSDCQSVDAPRTPPFLYTKALQYRLQQIIEHIPQDLLLNESIVGTLRSAQIAIDSVSFLKDGTISRDIPDMQRVDVLYSCLRSIRAFFDYFFTIRPADFPYVPFMIFKQLSHGAINLYRLGALDDPVWDRASVAGTIDLVSTMNAVADQLARVKTDAGLVSDGPDGDIYTKSEKMVRAMGGAWETSMARRGDAVTGVMMPTAGTATSGMEAMEGLELGGFPPNIDTRWFTDIWTPFDF